MAAAYGEINLWLANAHVGADKGGNHPTGNRDDNPRGAFYLKKLSNLPLLYPTDTNLQSEIGMPTIMDFPLFADMGR